MPRAPETHVSGESVEAPKRKLNAKWVSEIERKLLRVESPVSFVPTLAKRWKRSERQVWRYVAAARRRLAKRAQAHNVDADREQVRSMIEETYRGARTRKDARAQVAAAKLFAEVTGVVTKKVDVTSNGQTLGTVDPGDPRWGELQKQVYGAARQGVSDAQRPDSDAPELVAGDLPPVPAPLGD